MKISGGQVIISGGQAILSGGQVIISGGQVKRSWRTGEEKLEDR